MHDVDLAFPIPGVARGPFTLRAAQHLDHQRPGTCAVTIACVSVERPQSAWIDDTFVTLGLDSPVGNSEGRPPLVLPNHMGQHIKADALELVENIVHMVVLLFATLAQRPPASGATPCSALPHIDDVLAR